jgi:hypothetical protein
MSFIEAGLEAAVTGVLLVEDLISAFSGIFGPQWGIFLDGIPIVAAQSVMSFEFRQDWTIANYPIENGSFQTYDKVEVPFVTKVRFNQGGSLSDRTNFLNSIAAIAGDFNLYDVVTPEFIYLDCNITHYDYRRTANQGLGLITVDVWLQQIIVAPGIGFQTANLQSPTAADPASNGLQQTTPYTAPINGVPYTPASPGYSFNTPGTIPHISVTPSGS